MFPVLVLSILGRIDGTLGLHTAATNVHVACGIPHTFVVVDKAPFHALELLVGGFIGVMPGVATLTADSDGLRHERVLCCFRGQLLYFLLTRGRLECDVGNGCDFRARRVQFRCL